MAENENSKENGKNESRCDNDVVCWVEDECQKWLPIPGGHRLFDNIAPDDLSNPSTERGRDGIGGHCGEGGLKVVFARRME